MHYQIPYGKGELHFNLPSRYRVQEYLPPRPRMTGAPCSDDDIRADIRAFLTTDGPTARPHSIAIAINDGSRPPIQRRILPILISELEQHFSAEIVAGSGSVAAAGGSEIKCILCIANGMHTPQSAERVAELIPAQYARRCRIVNHDATDRDALIFLGTSSAGSPIWVNRAFYEAGWRISISAVTGHQFVGVTGGAKSVAIGLAGVDTITHNHSLYKQQHARLGEIVQNPVRRDIEEIGRKMGLSVVVNCALDTDNEIVAVRMIDIQRTGSVAAFNEFAQAVMRDCQIDSCGGYDGAIVSAGGYPRDCDLYQLQKALAHTAPLARPDAPIILCGACDDGVGGAKFAAHLAAADSVTAVLEQQQSEKFQIGPHKSGLFARDMQGRRVALISRLSPRLVRRLHFTPLRVQRGAFARFLARTHKREQSPRIALVPHATHCYFKISE